MNMPVPMVLRLVTGEDIIAETTIKHEIGNVIYSVADPLKIIYLPATQNTHISLSLMQWMFTRISDKQTFEIHERNVLFTTEPTDSLVEYYFKTIDYVYEIKAQQAEKIKMDKSTIQDEIYKDLAMMEDDELNELLDSDEMKEVIDMLEQLNKKDKGTLH